eukprot:scaffold1340_cov253-Pinguiococcus_pyrenoidosus.AAC.46
MAPRKVRSSRRLAPIAQAPLVGNDLVHPGMWAAEPEREAREGLVGIPRAANNARFCQKLPKAAKSCRLWQKAADAFY